MRPRLITIPISHYGERARWALDHARVAFDETHHLQMFSWVAAYWHGGGKTLPVLLTASGVLTDSADIVRYAAARADRPLYPDDAAGRAEVLGLERTFAGDYGVETRRVGYEWFFRSLDALLPYNAGRAPALEARAFGALRPGVAAVARRYLRVHPAEVARGRDLVTRTMDAVAERLRDGRAYLTGERFTAADLTFAAMSAPSLIPAQYGVPMPALSDLPDDAAAQVRAWRAHEAGRFALRLYATERRANP